MNSRTASPQTLLDWIDEPAPYVLVETAVDAVPSGLSAAMAPLVVDWEHSDLDGSEPHYIVRNVNIGGNPAGGRTGLATARIPAAATCQAEFVIVPLKVVGQDTPGAHAQLRFRFPKSEAGTLLDRSGEPLVSQAIGDIVISWEAWRPPGTKFDALKGLEPGHYALTTRCYHGPQRFLEDGLQNRPWVCHPISLPDVPGASDKLLYLALVIGDSMGRHCLDWIATKQEGACSSFSAWSALREALDDPDMPEDPLESVLGGSFDYDLLQRSCITMALTAIDTTMQRLHDEHELGAYDSFQIGPDEVPGWVRSLSNGAKHDVLTRVPRLFWWLMKNQDVVPTRSVDILAAAGLLQMDGDDPIQHRFDMSAGETPYGALEDHLIE